MSSDQDDDQDQDEEIITIGFDSDSPFEWTDEEIDRYIEQMRKELNE